MNMVWWFGTGQHSSRSFGKSQNTRSESERDVMDAQTPQN